MFSSVSEVFSWRRTARHGRGQSETLPVATVCPATAQAGDARHTAASATAACTVKINLKAAKSSVTAAVARLGSASRCETDKLIDETEHCTATAANKTNKLKKHRHRYIGCG